MKFKKIVALLKNRKKSLLAVLIDPDKYNPEIARIAKRSGVSCFLVGGSRLRSNNISSVVSDIKKHSSLPIILFPGDEGQLTAKADGLLLLSLLSGRNPEYLIEKHIRAAPFIKKMKLPLLSTAYLLIDGGHRSATQEVTGTIPLDPEKSDYIISTALAAEQLGFGAIYLEAGSGAKQQIHAGLIRKIKKNTVLPLIVGGGIDTREKAQRAIDAGADMIVIGNALENNVYLLAKIGTLFSHKK
jgi:phosphoglycerol geranylgeranyltransferase